MSPKPVIVALGLSLRLFLLVGMMALAAQGQLAASPEDPYTQDLSELSLVKTSWQQKDGKVWVRGTVMNRSERDWHTVTVNFRGFDQRGARIVDCEYKLPRVRGHGSSDFSFQVSAAGVPRRCEMGLVAGLPVAAHSSDLSELSLARTSWLEKNGSIVIKGMLLNSSELDWTGVNLSVRGFDRSGYLLFDRLHRVDLVPGNGARDFMFQAVSKGDPRRVELALLKGTRAESIQPSLKGLTVDNTAWREKDGHVLLTGTVRNASEREWRDVIVHLRGFDALGHRVINNQHTVPSVPSHGASTFSLRAETTGQVSRSEIGLIAGTSARVIEPAAQPPQGLWDLPDLSIINTSWTRKDGRIWVTGTLVNSSQTDWNEVTLNFRGFDAHNRAVTGEDHRVALVPGRGSAGFAFLTTSAALPSRCEMALISGTRAPEAAMTPMAARPALATPERSPREGSQAQSVSQPPSVPKERLPVAREPAAAVQESPSGAPARSSAPVVTTSRIAAITANNPVSVVLPQVYLSGLSMLDTTWRVKDGRVHLRGTVLNASEFGWSDVLVSVRGVDERGNSVVSGSYKIAVVPGHAICDFSFQVDATATPRRCEIGFSGGKR